jgi:sulfite exporter TauE/SafE
MCGPIALALPLRGRSAVGRGGGVVLYNLGRISTYGLLGAIAGSVGLLASLGEWQRGLSIVAGLVLLVGALGNQWDRLKKPPFLRNPLSFVQRKIQSQLSKRSFLSLGVLGMFNGLLPCGMLYVALLSAMAAETSVEGALYMSAFGAGTLPAMLATAFLGQWASIGWRRAFQKMTPYLIAFAGVVLIVRGFSTHSHPHEPANTPIPICVGK